MKRPVDAWCIFLLATTRMYSRTNRLLSLARLCLVLVSMLSACTGFAGMQSLSRPALHTRRTSRLLVLAARQSSTPASTGGASMHSSAQASQAPQLATLERFSVAPMMEYTDRYMRYFQRLLSRRTVLYTEMLTAHAITRTKHLDKHLKYDDVQHPIVLQIGGAEPELMAKAAAIAQPYGYDAINVNCGCPSSKVANAGAFGAALMKEAKLVADICRAMHDRINSTVPAAGKATPITVKSRIGVDDQDSYEFVRDFVGTVGDTGIVSHFVIHSRKAILNMNLSADQNRKIPPINYDVVYRLVQEFPQYSFVLNGQVKTYDEVREHLNHGVAGVMVGRDIVDRPFYWANVDSELYGEEDPGFTRREVLEKYCEYVQRLESEEGIAYARAMAKPVHHLFAGERGGKRFRHMLERNLLDKMSANEAIRRAMDAVASDILDLAPGCNSSHLQEASA